mgnify:CR=1 FL=1
MGFVGRDSVVDYGLLDRDAGIGKVVTTIQTVKRLGDRIDTILDFVDPLFRPNLPLFVPAEIAINAGGQNDTQLNAV